MALSNERITVIEECFKLESVAYPAFVIVYGPSKHGITSHNRSEWEEQFSCDVCMNVEQAHRLFEGYPGRISSCEVYVVPVPRLVQRMCSNGACCEYEVEQPELTYEQLDRWNAAQRIANRPDDHLYAGYSDDADLVAKWYAANNPEGVKQ